jgi:hypothetical protein
MSIVTYNNRSIRNISAIPGAAKSLTHIKTLTASSSSTLSFVDGSSDVVLDSTYPIYLFKFINIHPATNNVTFDFQGSTNTGSAYGVTMTTTSFEAYHDEGDSATTLGYSAASDLAQSTGFQDLTGGIGNGNDESGSGQIFLFNPSSTTFVKHFISTGQFYYSDDYTIQRFNAGYFNTTSAIDAIQFKMSSGNIDAGTIKLYGIKDS